MARVPVFISVADPTTGNALAGVTATVRNRSTGSAVTLYAAETGGTTVGNPLTTDANGRALAWADRAPFRIDYGGTGITAYQESRDVSPSSDRGIDDLLLPGGAKPAVVTSLPGSPADGDEVYLLLDAAGSANGNGPVLWHLRYRSGSTSAYKWEAIGSSSPLVSVQQGILAAGSTSYTSADVSVAIPAAGVYDVTVQHTASIPAGGTATGYFLAPAGPGVTAQDDYAAQFSGNASDDCACVKTTRLTFSAAGAVEAQRKYGGNVVPNSYRRRLEVRPVRIG